MHIRNDNYMQIFGHVSEEWRALWHLPAALDGRVYHMRSALSPTNPWPTSWWELMDSYFSWRRP
jgi:hypothetical protein